MLIQCVARSTVGLSGCLLHWLAGNSSAWRMPNYYRTFWMTVIALSQSKKCHILSLRPKARVFSCVPPNCWSHVSLWSQSSLLMTESLLRLSFEQHQSTQTVCITHPGWQHIKFIIQSMMICSLTTHPMLCLLQLANNRQSTSISHFDRMRATPTTDIQ